MNYLKVVEPALFNWDHYWQMFDGGNERYYWENLEIVRRNCVKAKVPFNQITVSLMSVRPERRRTSAGEDDDWTDVCRSDARGRGTSPLREGPRSETTLFTSFVSDNMAKALPAAAAKKIVARLKGQTIAKADFARAAGRGLWARS